METNSDAVGAPIEQNQNQLPIFPTHEIRSPLEIRSPCANTLAKAASPTGSACTKSISENNYNSPRHKLSNADYRV